MNGVTGVYTSDPYSITGQNMEAYFNFESAVESPTYTLSANYNTVSLSAN